MADRTQATCPAVFLSSPHRFLCLIWLSPLFELSPTKVSNSCFHFYQNLYYWCSGLPEWFYCHKKLSGFHYKHVQCTQIQNMVLHLRATILRSSKIGTTVLIVRPLSCPGQKQGLIFDHQALNKQVKWLLGHPFEAHKQLWGHIWALI